MKPQKLHWRSIFHVEQKQTWLRGKTIKGLKIYKINGSYPSLMSQKTHDLTSKELANEIKQYFDIDIYPVSIRQILIKFGHRAIKKIKNASNSCNEEKKIAMSMSSLKLVHWRLEKVLWTDDESKIELPNGNGQKRYQKFSSEKPLAQPKAKHSLWVMMWGCLILAR